MNETIYENTDIETAESQRNRTTERYKRHKMNLRRRVFEESGGCCIACGLRLQTEDYTKDNYCTFDHIKPKSKGGANSITNYQPMCRRCNQFRGNMDYEKWRDLVIEIGRNLYFQQMIQKQKMQM